MATLQCHTYDIRITLKITLSSSYATNPNRCQHLIYTCAALEVKLLLFTQKAIVSTLKTNLLLIFIFILSLSRCKQKSEIEGTWYACDKLGGGYIEMHIYDNKMLTYHFGIERLEGIPNLFKTSNDTLYYHILDPEDSNAGRALFNIQDSIFSMTTITEESIEKLPTRYKRIPIEIKLEESEYYQDQPNPKVAFTKDFVERANKLNASCLDQHLIKTHVEVFWEKFTFHELRIRNKEEGYHRNLSHWLRRIHPDLEYELQGDSSTSKLIFKFSGEQSNTQIIDDLLKASPELKNWKFAILNE